MNKHGVGNLKSEIPLFLAALSQNTRGCNPTATLDEFNHIHTTIKTECVDNFINAKKGK